MIAETHSGMTPEAFRKIAQSWLSTARHPRFGRIPTASTYQPQLELLAFLRLNAFKIFIVTGGGVDFVRAFSDEAYGVPPEQVVGSSSKTEFEVEGGKGQLTKLPELESLDDKRASQSTSTCTSACVRSSRSEIRTAISRCCSTRRAARGRP